MGDEYAWFVDPSTKKLAIGWANEQAHGVVSKTFPPGLKEGQRLAKIFWYSGSLGAELARERPPTSVFVEQPSGPNRNLNLDFAVGSIMAGLYDALKDLYLHPVYVGILNSTAWKTEMMIPLRKSKTCPDPKAFIMDRARELGYDGDDQDEADAFVGAIGTFKYVRFG